MYVSFKWKPTQLHIVIVFKVRNILRMRNNLVYKILHKYVSPLRLLLPDKTKQHKKIGQVLYVGNPLFSLFIMYYLLLTVLHEVRAYIDLLNFCRINLKSLNFKCQQRLQFNWWSGWNCNVKKKLFKKKL